MWRFWKPCRCKIFQNRSAETLDLNVERRRQRTENCAAPRSGPKMHSPAQHSLRLFLWTATFSSAK
jgi:hypothetical protein